MARLTAPSAAAGMYGPDFEFIVVEDTGNETEACWKPKSMRSSHSSAAPSRYSRSLTAGVTLAGMALRRFL